MSIATRTGDDGTTALMYKRRVSKTHPRIEACGAIDELNAAIGIARASSEHEWIRENLLTIQKDLIGLMGELATLRDDRDQYIRNGYSIVTHDMTAKLDALVKEIESQEVSFKGWATPGATLSAAWLDFARTTCRRAERRVCALKEASEIVNAEIFVYLNRLSDTLWLFARWVETKAGIDSRVEPEKRD